MAKKLKRKQNKKNWNKGLKTRAATNGNAVTSLDLRKGQILT